MIAELRTFLPPLLGPRDPGTRAWVVPRIFADIKRYIKFIMTWSDTLATHFRERIFSIDAKNLVIARSCITAMMRNHCKTHQHTSSRIFSTKISSIKLYHMIMLQACTYCCLAYCTHAVPGCVANVACMYNTRISFVVVHTCMWPCITKQ